MQADSWEARLDSKQDGLGDSGQGHRWGTQAGDSWQQGRDSPSSSGANDRCKVDVSWPVQRCRGSEDYGNSHSSPPESSCDISRDSDPRLLEVAERLLQAALAFGVDSAREAPATGGPYDVLSSTWSEASAGETGAEACEGDDDLTPNLNVVSFRQVGPGLWARVSDEELIDLMTSLQDRRNDRIDPQLREVLGHKLLPPQEAHAPNLPSHPH